MPRMIVLRAVAAGLAIAAPLAAGCGGSQEKKPAPRTIFPVEIAANKQVATAQREVQAAPKDPAALADLVRAHVRLGYVRGNITGNTIGPRGEPELRQAAAAWKRYLALHVRKPDPQLATVMARAFGQSGLNAPRDEIRALEVAAEHTRPRTAGLYSQLAVAYYRERDYRGGDRATRRAVALTALGERANLRRTLRQIRSQAKTQGP